MVDKIDRTCRMHWRANKFSLKARRSHGRHKSRCNFIRLIVTE